MSLQNSIDTFMEKGLEAIEINSDFKIIEALEDDVDTIGFSEVEQSLIFILRRWSDASSLTPIADKWKGGNLVLEA